MIIPTVIPRNGKPPSWKGKWFCSTNTTGNASKKKLSGGQYCFVPERRVLTNYTMLYASVMAIAEAMTIGSMNNIAVKMHK